LIIAGSPTKTSTQVVDYIDTRQSFRTHNTALYTGLFACLWAVCWDVCLHLSKHGEVSRYVRALALLVCIHGENAWKLEYHEENTAPVLSALVIVVVIAKKQN